MIMADIASLIGKKYNFGRDEGFINIIVDEASEIANEQLIQLLNKSRGAGVRMFVATQTISDYETRTGSKAMANMMIGNMNNTIMLRTIDSETQIALAARLPEVPIQYVMKTTGSSMGDKSHTGAFSVNHGERLMQEDKPIIAPSAFGDLSDLEYFAIFARGNLIKGRLPILIAPDDIKHLAEAQHFGEQVSGDLLAPESDLDDAHRAFEFNRPKVIEPEVQPSEDIEDRQDNFIYPPRKTWFTPLVRWFDVLPAFRDSDPKPEIIPDPYADMISRHEPKLDPDHWSTQDDGDKISDILK
jgi:hypothetical protein